MRSFLCASVVFMVALGALAGCTSSATAPSSRTSASQAPGAAVSRSAGGELTLASGVRVTVPKETVAGAGRLTGSVTASPAKPSGLLQQVGSTYRFEVTGTRLTGTGTVTLSLPVPDAGSGPEPVWLAYFSGDRWIPVPSRYDPATGTVTGTSTHLSLWTLVGLVKSRIPTGTRSRSTTQARGR